MLPLSSYTQYDVAHACALNPYTAISAHSVPRFNTVRYIAFHLRRSNSRRQPPCKYLLSPYYSFYTIHSLSTLITTPTLITVPGLDLSCTYMRIFHVPDDRHCPGMVPGTVYFHSYSISTHCIYTRTTYNKKSLGFPHSPVLSL
jgi:hypothetical protein